MAESFEPFPVLTSPSLAMEVGILPRKVEIYFVANTRNEPRLAHTVFTCRSASYVIYKGYFKFLLEIALRTR